jgi:hypothetical protein
LPGVLWIGVGVQAFTEVGIAAYLTVRRRRGASGWMVAGMATTGSSFIFTAGLYILITYRPTVEQSLGLAAFGMFCLALLVVLDRFGFVMETTGDRIL